MGTAPGSAVSSFLRSKVVRNLQVATKGLQQDLVAGEVTKFSVCTVRRILNNKGIQAQNPKRTLPQQKWIFSEHWISSVSGRRMMHIVKKHPAYSEAQQWVGDVLWLLYFLWQRKSVVRGGQDSFNQVLGHTKRKHRATCEGSEAWASLDFPAAQWSQAYLKVLAFTATRFEFHRKSLVGLM